MASHGEEGDAAVTHEVGNMKYPMLVDVVEFVQLPERMQLIIAAQIMRLDSLKDFPAG